jgi:hypothetical protein
VHNEFVSTVADAMNSAHDHILDQFSPEDGPDKRLTTWYAQGQSDALGDRLLMFDNTNLPSWEILRFKPALAHDPRFEAALRERVERLTSFQHQSFPVVRPIKRLGHDDGLAVVCTYSSGAPLSDALKRPRSVDFALRMVRQLVPALVALQRHASGLSHGALTADRIFLSTEGQLMIREHMVGSALESLELTVARLWSEFGILVPSSAATLDQRCDVGQLALIAVSLMAGRRVGPDEYPEKLTDVLEEIARRQHSHGPARFQSLRRWIERALYREGQPFESAEDAEAALAELRDDSPARPQTRQDEMTRTVAPEAPPKSDPTPPMWSAARTLPAPVEASTALSGRVSSGARTARDRVRQLWSRVPRSVIRAATVALCVVAVAEAVVIVRLLIARAKTPAAAVETRPVEPPRRLQVTPIEQPLPAPPPPIVTTSAVVEPKAAEIKPALPPAAVVRTGGFRVSAPIELHVLDGERVIGSSVDGPIMAPAGRREYDFVNSVIGYRVRRAVDVKAGQVTPVAVPVPNGTLNINAEPWAAVSIDGTSVGETPLGNLSVVPGEHEIVFRHPQLGERRQRIVVRADAETRVSVNLQK